ncbi:hypothetical protein C8Q79DRAFT_157821 [Trametes meyenii]|nr:hypothetical protein C8Q79DRAFT_157821 [Trametes meyenii]
MTKVLMNMLLPHGGRARSGISCKPQTWILRFICVATLMTMINICGHLQQIWQNWPMRTHPLKLLQAQRTEALEPLSRRYLIKILLPDTPKHCLDHTFLIPSIFLLISPPVSSYALFH